MSVAQITTYTELQSAVADWLNRTDLTTNIQNWIQLTEAEIDRRVKWSTSAASISIATETTPWPSDMAQPRSIRLVTSTGTDYPLTVCTSEQLADHRAAYGTTTGRPMFVCYERTGLIQVSPTPDTGYTAEITYYVGLKAGGANLASAPGGINYFITSFPDVYLYGCLTHAERFLEHEDAAQRWEAKFNEGVTQIQTLKDASDFPSFTPVKLPVQY